MSIVRNEIHERTVKAWRGLLAHQELQAYMLPVLLGKLKTQALFLEPLLETVAQVVTPEDDAVAAAEKTLAHSHDMIQWLHDGAKYRYRMHRGELTKVAPLQVGRDAAEDEIRLATLERELPHLKPAFLWLPDEGLTHAALTKQLKAHREAQKVDGALETKEKEALEALRKARPLSHALWGEEGGLEAWIIATVPKELHFAFGRERRHRPRAAKAAGEATVDKKKTPADPKTEGSTPPKTAAPPDQKTG